MRYWSLALAAVLAACAHRGTSVERESDVDLSRYHRVGVPPFTDRKGQGASIAGKVYDGLQGLGYGPVDQKALEKILADNKPEKEFGLTLEALELIRIKASADAVVFGTMAPDWSAASVTLVEAELGDPVLHAVVRPGKPGQKRFADADDVARETLAVFSQILQRPR